MTTTYQYHIEEASPKDASLLSDIAWQSKKHWGYPDAWMELWRDDLTITAELIENNHCCKLLHEGKTAGYAIICSIANGFEIEHCFVLPAYIGKGCGSTLLKHMLAEAQYQGTQFDVLADPNAVTFYEKFGFKTVENIPSKPAGRTLPLMRMVNDGRV